jgi:drug/metabolite transporter (DMT)-like permease
VPTFLIAVISAISTWGAGLAMSMVESWSWPAPPSVALLMLAAATVTTGYYFAIVSMRTGETAVVSPFRYSAMLFALLSSLLIFGERPDAVSMLGVAIVMAAGGYTFHREQVRKRETAAAGHSAIERAA